MAPDIRADIERVSRIEAVPTILEVVCRTTGMGFAALARVTADRWIACGVRDEINFGLKPGGELRIETTICNEIRQSRTPVVINHVAEDDAWRGHATPAMYGFQSYISVPIVLGDGSFFGTLCAIDPRPARLNTPEITGMFKLFADLIARHLDASRKLTMSQEHQRRWQNLLLQVPAAIAVLRGPTHVFDWVNDEYARLLRRPAAALIGKTALEAVPAAADQVYGMLDGIYKTGEPVFGHESLVHLIESSGTLQDTYINFVCTPTRNDAAEIDGIFLHITDVTDTVVARKRVEESEERFRQLADSMPQIVWTAPPDGRPDYHNARWYAFSGRDHASESTENWASILHPADARTALDAWEGCLQSGEPFEMEARLRDHSRDCWRWFMCRAIAVTDSEGRVSKWFGTCTDIDEQKASQHALLQTQKLESIGLLAGGIAHDFNNLLVGIMGGASFALDTIAPSHPAYSMLESVVEASERAADLTRQMLAYAGKGRFVIERVNLSDVVFQTSKLAGASLPKSVEVRLQLAERLPTIEMDRGQMQQVVMNLIINAAESAGAGNGLVVVRTRAEEILPGEVRRSVDGALEAPGLYAVLEVEDLGCGIDAVTLTKIFDPFFTTKFTGRGLGLAAVSGVVRALRGSIEVETEVGQGSTFRVLLPASQSPAEGGPGSRVPADKRQTVLLIDDEEVVRKIAKAALEKSEYRALVADSGAQGLEHIRANPEISLVLLDMSMPGMGGRQVMEELKIIRPRLPVIICSGYSEDEVHMHFSGLEIAGVLEKPFTPKVLTAKIRTVLPAPGSP